LSIEPRIKVGTVAFVTGASSGIGRAIATALVREGCRVVLAGRNQEALWSLASSLGEEAHPLVLDVTIGLSVDKIPDCLPEKFRDIGILVNSAGHDPWMIASLLNGRRTKPFTAILEKSRSARYEKFELT
jgi:NADP-dependent 3-hydroxy acid dehydrogenase YdfG